MRLRQNIICDYEKTLCVTDSVALCEPPPLHITSRVKPAGEFLWKINLVDMKIKADFCRFPKLALHSVLCVSLLAEL